MSLPIAEILAPPNVDYVRILPELVLSVFGMLIMVLDPLIGEYKAAKTLGTVALVGAVASEYVNESPSGSTAFAS